MTNQQHITEFENYTLDQQVGLIFEYGIFLNSYFDKEFKHLLFYIPDVDFYVNVLGIETVYSATAFTDIFNADKHLEAININTVI